MVFVVSETTVLSSECSMFAWLKEEVGVASSLDSLKNVSLEDSLVIEVSSVLTELKERALEVLQPLQPVNHITIA